MAGVLLRHLACFLHLGPALGFVVTLALPAAAQECGVALDFLALPLPSGGDPIETALEAAYPGLDLELDRGRVILPDGRTLPALSARAVDEPERLEGATLGDQFATLYPLAFETESRQQPWFDPGRVRDEAFMRALWFDSEAAARASLVRVAYSGVGVAAEFRVSTRHCAHVQAAAALAEVAALGPEMEPFFRDTGGGFAWRPIAGTDRLSMHAYGAAIDLNAELGGYWRWTGAAEGQVGEYTNRIPPDLVRAMERHGFVWGGKWHHFDGMHFEYRPELILHARLVGE